MDKAVALRIQFNNKTALAGDDPFLTCYSPGEGVGSMALRYVTVMTASCKYQRSYIHTPFSRIAHVPADVPPRKWDGYWENFLNLGLDETIGQPAKKLRWCYREVTGHDIEQIDWIFRDKYYDSPKPALDWFSSDDFNIAMHVRRGDALQPEYRARVTENDEVLAIIREAIVACSENGRPLRLHIMSEGTAEDFKFLDHCGIRYDLHLDECTFTTFHHLVEADAMIMAKSTFSYLAGILSEKQVFYQPFWHDPLPRWSILKTK